MAFQLSPDGEQILEELLKRYPTQRAACIPLLHLCQEESGWVSDDVVQFVADRLELTTAQVKGVVTFYTSLHQEPVAPNVVWVCRTLSCELRGGKKIQEHLEHKLGCHAGGTSKDGKFTLKTAECLAACGNAPMIQVNDAYYEDLTLEKLDKIIDELREKPAPRGLGTARPRSTGAAAPARASVRPSASPSTRPSAAPAPSSAPSRSSAPAPSSAPKSTFRSESPAAPKSEPPSSGGDE